MLSIYICSFIFTFSAIRACTPFHLKLFLAKSSLLFELRNIWVYITNKAFTNVNTPYCQLFSILNKNKLQVPYCEPY